MKFKLIYFGDIFVNPKKRAQHIADIRMQFHPQLKKLVECQSIFIYINIILEYKLSGKKTN